MTKCFNCEKDGEHWHHVVPKSRGGSDEPSNLVLLCLDCHSRAHDVSFKGDKGLIKEAVQRTKADWKISAVWFSDNFDDILDFLSFLQEVDDVLHDYLVSGMTLDYIRNDDIFKVFTGKSTRSALALKKAHKDILKSLWGEFQESRYG